MGTTVRLEPPELAVLKRALGRQLAAARQAATCLYEPTIYLALPTC